jgi:hypothetical protein
MKKLLLISFMYFIGITCFSQTILFKQEVNDTTLGKRGQNLKNYSHFYLGFGFIGGKPDSTGSDIIMGKSINFVFGFRYKLRISNFFAIGYDLALNSYSYAIKQTEGKVLEDTIMHVKQKFGIGDLEISPYMRFNFGKRGNRIGNFVDLGAYGGWNFSASNFTRDKLDNGNVVRTTTRHLEYINPWNYGFMARIGFNRWVIYGYYRMSDNFKTTDIYDFPELPRITVGVQIGLHK